MKVISSHISGRSRQQGPRLSLVVRDESLDVTVHYFVGEIHAVYPLDLQRETANMHVFFLRYFPDVSVMFMVLSGNTKLINSYQVIA